MTAYKLKQSQVGDEEGTVTQTHAQTATTHLAVPTTVDGRVTAMQAQVKERDKMILQLNTEVRQLKQKLKEATNARPVVPPIEPNNTNITDLDKADDIKGQADDKNDNEAILSATEIDIQNQKNVPLPPIEANNTNTLSDNTGAHDSNTNEDNEDKFCGTEINIQNLKKENIETNTITMAGKHADDKIAL